jgi:D-alanyl-D-alanine carboxypeptidase
MKFFLYLIGLIFISTPVLAQVNPNPPVYQQEIQRILSNWRARSGIPGAALSIYLPDHTYPITISSGSTQFRGGESIDSTTLFQAGSITKSFTSMIILELESEGKLNLNDPITNYLPQYPRWQNVTVRELLNHTSGIFNYTEAGQFNLIRKKNPEQGFSPEQLVQLAAEHRDYFYPGQGWKYSNTNYVLAGMIISKITGEPASTIMNDYLRSNTHLDLLNTYYLSGIYPNVFLSRMAHGYNSQGQDVTYDNMSWAYTAGAIVTTTQDLLTWWHDLFQGHILPQQQLDEMKSLVCESSSPFCRVGQPIPEVFGGSDGHGYGLGIIETGYGSENLGPVWWHNGSTAGYKAIVMWFPKSDIYIALTINRDPGYLLRPDLPVIREAMDILSPDAEWHLAHPVRARTEVKRERYVHHIYHRRRPVHHYFRRKPYHKIEHKTKEV